MAIQTFTAVAGQSIYDVCLNTYGSLNLLYKLIQDNNVNSVNDEIASRQLFLYDDELVIDQGLSLSFAQNRLKYATEVGKLGSTFYIIEGVPTKILPIAPKVTIPKPMNTYESVNSSSYTSSADGTNIISLIDKDGNTMVGYDLVEVELEIKPLKANQYQWNPATSVLTLLGGTVLDNGQTIFYIYKKLITA